MSDTNDNEQIAQRRAKLSAWREQGNAFPNGFRRNALAGDLHAKYDQLDKESLEGESVLVSVAGRLMSKRVQGRVSFAHLQDATGQIQLFVQRDNLPESFYNEQFKKFDIGDILGASGTIFKTNKGELSVRVDNIQLLTKSLRPLPEKFHGLTDQESRYRQRYVDLVVNESTRNTFKVRSAIISYIRNFFLQRDYLEVETPMMQSIPGGAVARPFKTYHNALGMDLFLRIAPELYLKRLVVGGFERVFEINRNFRNEGISTQHNPEFTMLEFYQAYADYHDLMDLTEVLFRGLALDVMGSPTINYQSREYDFSKPFERLTIKQAVLKYNQDIDENMVADLKTLREIAERLEAPVKDSYGVGRLQIEIYEKTAEHQLIDPTFVTAFPVEVSPLSRRNDTDPTVSDRFELLIAGKEIANGFSELNDPEDQAERFKKQAAEKDAGDLEAMHYDADYVRALEYGLPPTAGEGIGIDRLVMLLTDSPSIRDVLLFPHMRAQQPADLDG